MADCTPKTRAENLKQLKPTAVQGKDPPVALPDDAPARSDATFRWCEELRDHHEKEGDLLTPACLVEYAKNAGVSVDETEELVATIKEIYGNGSKKAGKSPAKGAAPAKKEKVKNVATKTSKTVKADPKKANGKAKNGKAEAKVKPNGNGKHAPAKASKNGNGKKEAVGKVLLDTKVNGVPVYVELKNDKIQATAFGQSLRGVMRFYGSKKLSTAQARAAGEKLLKAMTKGNARFKNGEEYVRQIVADGHVASGAKGDGGIFGPVPKFGKEEAAKLLALAK